MLEDGLFVEFGGCAVIFADDHRELSARVAHNGSGVHTLNSNLERKDGGRDTVGEGLMFREAVRVPRHAFSPNCTGSWAPL